MSECDSRRVLNTDFIHAWDGWLGTSSARIIVNKVALVQLLFIRIIFISTQECSKIYTITMYKLVIIIQSQAS